MPEAYDIHEARFLQARSSSASAANALDISLPIVPEGKVWTILSAAYMPSVAETKIVYFAIMSHGYIFPVTVPVSVLLNPVPLACLEQGLELKLYPGEYLIVYRDSATAGSTMIIRARMIESDLPYYSYEEPLNKVVKQAQRHGSVYRSTGGISTGGGPVGSGAPGKGGSGGGPESY